MANLRQTISVVTSHNFNSLNALRDKVILRPSSNVLSIPATSSKSLHSSSALFSTSVLAYSRVTAPTILTSSSHLTPPTFLVHSKRTFTTSAHLEGNQQRFKKAGDVEAASKARKEGSWSAPTSAKKKELSAEEAHLAKMTPEEMERWLVKKPVDNVWLQKHYPQRVFNLESIIKMNRQANHPSMLDNPHGDLLVELSLNMQGLKLTKPMKSFSVLTHVPFKSPYSTCEPRYVAVLVKNTELQSQMEAKGATFVGGEELIVKLKNGLIQKDTDYDYLIAHMDIIQELGLLLKKKHAYLMPTEKEGTLGFNLMEMFNLHQNGYLLQVKANSEDPMKGSVTFSLGKLSHSLPQMLANLDVMMKILRLKRPTNLTPKRGSFITGASVKCAPNSEVFKWDFEALNQFIDEVETETVFEDGEKTVRSARNS